MSSRDVEDREGIEEMRVRRRVVGRWEEEDM